MPKAEARKGPLKALKLSKEEVLADYELGHRSRQASLLGRKEVFSGKAKFGIFGDGKELAQIGMARAFDKGDFRSGYYRDQTFMFALGLCTIEQFFAQLYAHADLEAEPCSAGRSMTAHFGTRFLDESGNWQSQVDQYNSAADISPTGSQMPRLVGLAYASRLYRELDGLEHLSGFSNNGREIAFGTIGNASCAEGLFWESVNAIGVLQAPAVISVWDDGYGISVPNEYQVTKSDISKLLEGFRREPGASEGYDIYKVPGWDYPTLVETYREAAGRVRADQVPALVHVIDVTQPQGHSTSGSHERYKSEERLAWETEFDCLARMREWMLDHDVATTEELDTIEARAKDEVLAAKTRAWDAFSGPILKERDEILALFDELSASSECSDDLNRVRQQLSRVPNPGRRELMRAMHDALVLVRSEPSNARDRLEQLNRGKHDENRERYSSHLHSESEHAVEHVPAVAPVFSDDSEKLLGFELLNKNFDRLLALYPELVAFGEDVGKLGDVNQGFLGLQDKYGEQRVADSGIREATLLGQAIGMAMRGLRPIVEIQYLDYLLYALQIMSDDLATLQYRTRGGQKSPVIVRTRGHRLEGIWHSGSEMAAAIHLLRGIHICVPRDMTRAAGFYNTLLESDESALIVEVLNGYRIRETMPDNLAEYKLPLGQTEVIRPGSDVTIVTYGACCRIAQEAAEQLSTLGIETEIIDVQTLLPFDITGGIVESIRKTSRVVFLDEDMPGGTTAYMMQQVLDEQDGYEWLDSKPLAIAAQPHRPAYGSDGDYWSKPNREEIVRRVYALFQECDPGAYPPIPFGIE